MAATIAPALPDDASALARIARAAYETYVPLIGREPAPMLQDFPADIADGAVWTARVADGPVGYVVARPKGEDWLLENVAVAPEAQGTGLGKRLIARAEAEGAARGFARVILYTNAKMTANLSLYPSLGYVETGRREQDGFDRVFFVKALANG